MSLGDVFGHQVVDEGKTDVLKTCIESGLVQSQLGWCPWGSRAGKAGSGIRGTGSISGGHGVKRLVFFFARLIVSPLFGIAGESIPWKHSKSTRSPTFPDFPRETSEAVSKKSPWSERLSSQPLGQTAPSQCVLQVTDSSTKCSLLSRTLSMSKHHVARFVCFLYLSFYFLWTARRHISSTFSQSQSFSTKKAPPSLKRLLQPVNHTNIPPLHKRVSEEGDGKSAVHDPSSLKKTSMSLTIHGEEKLALCAKPGSGVEGEKGAAILNQMRDRIESKRSEDQSRTKLFCAIYTYSGNVNMTNAVRETWGRRCDGALFASDVSNEETGHFRIPTFSHNGYGYRGMIQRTRAILAYLYDYFLNDYDFFHICGDDVYMIVENMKEFLGSDEVRRWESKPGHSLFAGFWAHWGKMKEGYFYLGGGSGYTMSKNALKAFVEGPLQTCNPYQEGSAEDVWFSDCARLLSNEFLYTGDTEGRQRYHQGPIYDPVRYHIFRQSILHSSRLTGIPSAPEEGIVSNSSILFHRHYYPFELRRMDLLLYGNFEEFYMRMCS